MVASTLTLFMQESVLPLVNEDGLRFDGLVLEVKEDVVVLDFKPPLGWQNSPLQRQGGKGS